MRRPTIPNPRSSQTLTAAPSAAAATSAALTARSLIADGSDGRSPQQPAAIGVPRPIQVTASAGISPSAPQQRIAVAQAELAIAKYRRDLLRIPGVLSVRRGYKVTNGWISTTPAIVVTVREKQAQPALNIPEQLDGVLVDVAPASPREQLLALSPEQQKTVDMSYAADMDEVIRTSRYVPPEHLSLDQVERGMTVLCHVSPDAGWPTLKQFMRGVTQRLTVGMYDFTAPHVLTQLVASMKTVKGPLRLVLDPKLALNSPGEGDNPKANDKTEDTVREELEKALGKRLDFVWAAIKLQGKTTAGIFANSYHIKVAVRDGRAFWLSSGNWQSSNQPDVAPLTDHVDGADVLRTYNREWHVVIQCPPLAQLYEAYLEYDFEQAQPLQVGPEAALLPNLAIPPTAELEVEEVAPQFVAPKEFTFSDDRPLRVQPLLSPDNYAEHTLRLIESARRTLYIQNQYIKIAKENADEFLAILNAIKKRIAEGVDVRIIVRDLPDVRTQLEALQDFGFAMSQVKVLRSTHTKGVIVDSSVVMIGSHNWSNDGVLYNRDASLIFFDEDIARYYEQIFLYDWSRARQQLHFEEAMPVIVGDSESAPIGHDVVPWHWIYDED